MTVQPYLPAAAGVGLLYLLSHLGNAAGGGAGDAAAAEPTMPDMGTRDPMPDVSTQALPQPAAQPMRRSVAALPPTDNAPFDQAAQAVQPAPQALPPKQEGSFQLSDLLPLLGASAVAGQQGALAPQSGVNAKLGSRAPSTALPVSRGQSSLPIDAEFQSLDGLLGKKALPTPQKQLTGPTEQQGPPNPHDQLPNDVERADHPPIPPEKPDVSLSIQSPEHMKTFSTGGKTYFADGDGNIYNEAGETLGKAAQVFGGAARLQLQKLGILGRAVK